MEPEEIIYIVANPVAGNGEAPDFIRKYVIPVLTCIKDGTVACLYQTHSEGNAVQVGQELYDEYLELPGSTAKQTIIIGGGDGTAHEVIEGILRNSKTKGEGLIGRWNLVVLPLGTANALFHSLFPPGSLIPTITYEIERTINNDEVLPKVSSLLSYLNDGSAPRHLPITLTSLCGPEEEQTPDPIPSHIVISTALHAGILETSETLRFEYPGVERFEIAARLNVNILHPATVKLLPGDTGSVKQYSPRSKSFVEPFTAKKSNTSEEVILEGPFAYFLSSNTAPRLEEKFMIVPTLQTIPSDGTAMDVVILRPLRDPNVQEIRAEWGDEAISEAWSPRIWEALMNAYKEGRHVDLVYDGVGPLKSAEEGEGEGEDVCVEVFRCGGFEWTPTDLNHEPSHVVCADGSLHTIPQGGKIVSTLMKFQGTQQNDNGFYVYGPP